VIFDPKGDTFDAKGDNFMKKDAIAASGKR